MKAVKRPGLVGLLGGLDRLLPGRAVGAACRERTCSVLRERALREGDDDLERRLGALARLDHVVPLAARRVGEQLGLAGEQVGEEAHVVGVVGDDEEVERPRELRRLAAGGRDLLAPGEAIGVARRRAGAERAGIQRERRVQVRVAEERPRREVAVRVGRIRPGCLYAASALSLSSVPVSCADAGESKTKRQHAREGRLYSGYLVMVFSFRFIALPQGVTTDCAVMGLIM